MYIAKKPPPPGCSVFKETKIPEFSLRLVSVNQPTKNTFASETGEIAQLKYLPC